MESEDARIADRQPGEGAGPGQKEGLWMRLLYMVLVAVMINLAQTILFVATVVQFIIMLVDNKKPNERLAEFGTGVGIWIAKAARFQTAGSEVKPWPWSDLD